MQKWFEVNELYTVVIGLESCGNLTGVDTFFKAKSVAIYGASPSPNSVGQAIIQNFIKPMYEGKVYAVNPRYSSVLGIPCYPTLQDIPGPVEMVVVAVPARITPRVFEDIAAKGVGAAIVVSGGFSETGTRGTELEDEIVAIARKNGIRIIGPNCVGVIDTHSHVDTFFLPEYRCGRPKSSNVANISLVSQSGAFAAAIADWAAEMGLGISKIVSLGSKCDVDDDDLLCYLGEDSTTQVICYYTEGYDENKGRTFFDTAKRITQEKPVIVVKSGRGARAKEASMSHTGSLAGSDNVAAAAYHQAGIIRPDNFEQMFDMAKALAMQPPAKGDRVLMVTNGGGLGVMTTDAIEAMGLSQPPVSPELRERFEQRLPPYCGINNPVDVVGDAGSDRYDVVFEEAIASDEYDIFVVGMLLQTPSLGMEITNRIAYHASQSGKPFIVISMGGGFTTKAGEIMELMGIPTYATGEKGALAAKALAQYGEIKYGKEFKKTVNSGKP
ncbi:MAG: CoA-binding protein [Candidatus Thorarchaeota archaeon]|nr:CoA-binding protein [Candidatus Thorarchaeota archaeon]